MAVKLGLPSQTLSYRQNWVCMGVCWHPWIGVIIMYWSNY